MILHYVEKIIRKLKNDPSYSIKTDYTSRQLFYSLIYRMLQILRGYRIKIKFSGSRSFVFCGRDVVVEHGYMVSCGRNLVLEDRVFISGISENGIRMGDNVSIGKNSVLIGTAVIQQKGVGITIGDNVGINANCYLGGQGGIIIENDVDIGPGVNIFSENHNFNEPGLIRKQGVSRKKTIIENNCWIGAGVTVLSGVTIHAGCVIAASSVVTKDVPNNSVVAGVPAKVIKTR